MTDFDVEGVIQGFGSPFLGVQFQLAMTEQQNLTAYIGFDEYRGSLLGAEYLYDIPLINDRLEFNVGAGLGRYNYKWKNYYTNGVTVTNTEKYTILTGVAGFTYNFRTTPLSIFTGYKPKVSITSFDLLTASDIILGIGYRF